MHNRFPVTTKVFSWLTACSTDRAQMFAVSGQSTVVYPVASCLRNLQPTRRSSPVCSVAITLTVTALLTTNSSIQVSHLIALRTYARAALADCAAAEAGCSAANGFQPNARKTEVIQFDSQESLRKDSAHDTSITVGDQVAQPSSCVRVPGVLLDAELWMR